MTAASSSEASATAPGPAPDAPESVQRLAPLIGRWASSGEMVDPATGARTTVVGTDEYAWVAGGWFVEHRVDVLVGTDPVRVLEVIGEIAPDEDALLCRAYDAQGGVGVMRASVDERGRWRFFDDRTRAALTVAADGSSMAAEWELAGDDGWVPWMTMRFTRLA